MKGRNNEALGARAFQQLAYALAHFTRGLVRESHGCNVAGLVAAIVDHPRDFLRDHAGFAAACARKHEEGSVDISDCLMLT